MIKKSQYDKRLRNLKIYPGNGLFIYTLAEKLDKAHKFAKPFKIPYTIGWNYVGLESPVHHRCLESGMTFPQVKSQMSLWRQWLRMNSRMILSCTLVKKILILPNHGETHRNVLPKASNQG